MLILDVGKGVDAGQHVRARCAEGMILYTKS
jgi:hypothetical protein